MLTKSILFILISVLSCKTKEQKVTPKNIASTEQNLQKKQPKKLYYFLGELDTGMQNLIKSKSNIEAVKVLDEGMIMDQKLHKVDHKKITENLNRIFPNPSMSGVCYLNVESPYIEMIRDKDIDDPEFKKGLDIFMEIIKTLKKQRPNVKFGFYAVPFTTYWETTFGFFKKNDKIAPLLKEVDILFPSLYMFYDDGIVGMIKNREYLESNMKSGLQLSIKYNKPLMPFVWHRYHPSNEKVSLRNMTDSEWTEYLKTIMNYEYKNKTADGLMWWGADSWEFEMGFEPYKKEFKGTKQQFQKFNDKNLVRKTNIVLEILSSKK